MTECPFCRRDPFHYVDIGVGMEAAAVTCCDLGDLLFRGERAVPDEVTISWDEFVEIANRLAHANRNLLDLCDDEGCPHYGTAHVCRSVK